MLFVSLVDANAYALWPSKETGKRCRLSSKAQRDFTTRAGTPTSFGWASEVGENPAHCFDCKTGLNPL
jgi:formylglycine-generating enzyme required for sulfatase activity